MSVKEAQAHDLLLLLRGHDVEQKIAEFSNIKAQVKHQAVQTEAINPLFEACRLGIQSSNYSLSAHALSCLGHLIRRVTIQEPSRIRPQAHHVLPLLIEKLGDQKERNRSIALNAVMEIWKTCPAEVEKFIKEVGFASKNPKTRQESVAWLAQVHKTQQGFSFRAFTPYLMKLLEDPGEPVRETTKEVVVELFKSAPDHAKSDLKRELQKRQVRKGIATYIVSQLGLPGSIEPDIRSIKSGDGNDDDGASSIRGKSVAGSIGGSMASSTYVASLPGSEMEDLEPLYVNTNRELEEMLREMVEPFEGKESEHNWAARDRNITKLRRLARGNACLDYSTTLVAGIKSLLDGILKTANSLRTVVATNGCQLVKDLAIALGPGLDPWVDILLTNFIKLCAGTKKITSQLGQLVVAVTLANVSYDKKIMAHMLGACNDKNVQPRSYAAGWIKIILETHIDHKGYLEHSGGIDVLEKCLKRGLADANPGVRENMRNTFWKFAVIWPERAEVIMNGLDNSSKKLLEKENPSGASAVSKTSTGRPQTAGRSTGTAATRPSIKDTILASKRSKGNLRAQTEPLEVPTQRTVPPAPTGLGAGPVRRPHMKTRSGGAGLDKGFPDPGTVVERGGYARSASPATTVYSSRASPMPGARGNGVRSPPLSPPHRFARGTTPARGQSQLAGTGRKLTVLEQLNHSDWKVRVEGVVIVACILAKRTPPNYEGQKMPTLPPSDVFAPTLAKLLNDPQPEVVEHVVAPEVLAELAKVVPMDQIVPKVLLLSQGDDEQHTQPITASSIPALKQLMSESEAAELLFRILTSMGTTGVVPRKLALGSFTTTQKRRISHGCLIWLNELVEAHANGVPNDYLGDSTNYRALINRLIGMLNTTKPPNYASLATLLKSLERLDPDTFERILATLESHTVRELRRAWGVNVEEDSEVVVEEKVADVAQVLGTVPLIGGTTHSTSRAWPAPEAFSPPANGLNTLVSDSPQHLKDEDLTLIQIPPAPRPVTPPRQTAQDQEALRALPPLPATPEQIPDLLANPNISVRKGGRPDDQKPVIEVYQDPVVDSNGAVAMNIGPDKSPASGGNEWQRYAKLKKQTSNSNLANKAPEYSSRLLVAIITRLQTRDMDTQAFRKLIGIARQNPVRAVLQEHNGEDVQDIWEGGRVFDELLNALLEYLDSDDVEAERVADLRVQGLLVLKQLLAKAAPYVSRHESALLSTLINLRGLYPTHSHVTTGIEDISEELLAIADPKIGIDTILDIILLKDNPSYRPATQSWCMALTCLAALVRASKPFTLESQFGRLGQLAVKSLDDEDAEIRRACVTMCIEMHSKLNDDEKLFDEILRGMKSGHQNLLTYYFSKREGEMRQ